MSEICPNSEYLHTTWCLISMCLDLRPVTGFRARSMAPLLSQCRGILLQWCSEQLSSVSWTPSQLLHWQAEIQIHTLSDSHQSDLPDWNQCIHEGHRL